MTMLKAISLWMAVALVLAPLALGVGVGSASSIRATGTVSAASPTSLTVAADTGQSLTFRLVVATAYELDGQPANLSALQVGERVEVKYHVESDGSLKAKLVKIKTTPQAAASAPIRMSGTVVSVTADALVVKDSVTGQQLSLRLDVTTIYERNAAPVAWSDLRPGQDVKLKYRVEANGSPKAQKVKIQVQQAPVVRFQLVGVDVGVASATLRVRPQSLREDGAAVAAGRSVVVVHVARGASILLNRRSVLLRALRHGDRLDVSGTVAGGVFTAVRVVARRGR